MIKEKAVFRKKKTAFLFNVSSMKTKNYYTVILRSDSDEESFKDSSLRSECIPHSTAFTAPEMYHIAHGDDFNGTA